MQLSSLALAEALRTVEVWSGAGSSTAGWSRGRVGVPSELSGAQVGIRCCQGFAARLLHLVFHVREAMVFFA